MNKYLVAYLSLGEGELTQTLVEADSVETAMLKYLIEYRDIVFVKHDTLTAEDADFVAEKLYDMDAYISVYKLD